MKPASSNNNSINSDVISDLTLLKTVIDNYPGLVWVKNKELQYLLQNENFERVLQQKSNDSYKLKKASDIWPAALADQLEAEDRNVIENAVSVNSEQMLFVENEWRTYELFKTPVFDKNNQVVGLIGYAKDISIRKQNEETILQLSTALDQSPSNVVITNPSGRIVYVNRRFEQLTGFSKEEVLGKNPRILKSEKSKVNYSILWQTIKSGGKWQGEFINKKKNGEEFWESASISPLVDAQGNITHFIAIKDDITAKKKEQANILEEKVRFSQITENLTEVVWLSDLENKKILYVNPAFEKVWGYSCDSFYANAEIFSDAVYVDDKADYKLWLEEYYKTGVYEHEFRILRPDMLMRWVKVNLCPVKNAEGKIIRHTGVAVDITDLKNAELTLRREEEKYRVIAENSSDVIWVYNVNHQCYTYVSPSVYSLRGITADEAIWERLDESFSQDSLPVLHRLINENAQLMFFQNAKTIYSIDQVEHVRKDGSIVRCEVSSHLYFNERGETELIGSSRSIEDRLQLEHEKQRNEVKYRLLFENSPFGIMIANADGEVLESNTKLLNIFKSGSLEHLKHENLFAHQLLNENGYNKAFAQCLSENKTIPLTTYYVLKNGRTIYLSGYLIPLFVNNGVVESVYTILEDVTHRRKVEEDLALHTNLQRVLMKIASEYINLDIALMSENINRSLGELSDFIDADRALIFEYNWDEDFCVCTYEWCDHTLEAQMPHLQRVPLSAMTEWTDAHKKGEILDIARVEKFEGKSRDELLSKSVKSIISVPLMKEGKCIGFISFDSIKKQHTYSELEKSLIIVFAQILVNLSLRLDLERKLIDEKEKAQNANKSKSQFLANMSHELRTPLNGVIGFSNLLMQTEMNNVQKQYTNAINTCANNLYGVINDILDFSKIEANKLELEKARTPIYELFENSVEVIKVNASKKGIEILIDIDDTMPYYAFVDSVRLTQIITNLLSNAVKFTNKGEVELKVKYQQIDDLNGRFNVSVRDTGIGISDEQKTKLFKAFSQADSSTTRKFGGTGLGLKISDMIAQKMGGKIEVDSELGVGTVFYFAFDTEVERDCAQVLKTFERKLNVLIVDENRANCMNMVQRMAKWGVNCETCESAYDALMILNFADPFDLIFVNNGFASMNGFDACKMIADKKNIDLNSIVLMHASTEDYLFYEECNDFGLKQLIAKPIKRGELYGLLEQFISNNKKTNEQLLNTETNMNANMKILIADDDMFNMMLAKAMIGNIVPNATIYEAVNGKIAYDLSQKHKFDLIFMDVQMPEMDGNDATKAIRSYELLNKMHTPIVGLTAGALVEEKEKCLNAGMNDFLTKPIDTSKLKNVIQHYLQAAN